MSDSENCAGCGGPENLDPGLQPFNGRNSSVDAYQEALDLSVYLKQTIIERREIATLLKMAIIRAGDLLSETKAGNMARANAALLEAIALAIKRLDPSVDGE